MLEQSKEFTIYGIPPITISNKTRLLSVKAFGKCVQNGTPTPDNPVDIVCNNGVLKGDNQGNVYADGTVETIEVDTTDSTATVEMLLNVDNYQDVQSILDGIVTRNVGVKVFNGTENWEIQSHNDGRVICKIDNIINDNTKPLKVTHGIWSVYATYRSDKWRILTGRYICCYTSQTSLADWKEYLAAQYAAGTPVIVVYPLNKSITETVAGQTLALKSGTNIIDITQASLQGLELEVIAK